MRICRTGDGVCVVSDNEVLVMFVIPDSKDTARNISHTVRNSLLKDEIN
jgi:flavin reductase (DIM6/NTAB) family NADH-FMN oxidoreductase RutF